MPLHGGLPSAFSLTPRGRGLHLVPDDTDDLSRLAICHNMVTVVVLDRRDGMPEDCALLLDNLSVVPQALFRRRITRLSAERMSEVCRALSFASGCA
jgi:hypothetical protein